MKSVSRRTSLDPKEVIQYAYDKASRNGQVHYVRTGGKGFVAVQDQPPPTASHWKVGSDGELWAHTDAFPGATVYRYEPCDK